MEEYIFVKGAREHNLKNINLKLPRNKLIVFTGLSGSGKSSLAFDTIYAEGQRRYIESLSAYARQFLGQMQKPDVDYIDGLSPAVAIDQKARSHNPRSTVGTVTEIYDYLRLLFARIGQPHCPNCGLPIEKQSIDQMVETILREIGQSRKIIIFARVVAGRKGEYHQLLYDLYQEGFSRVRVNAKIHRLKDKIVLSRYRQHTIDLVVDELKVDDMSRLADSLEIGLKYGKNSVIIKFGHKEIILSAELACLKCGFAFSELSPRLFSFNSPYGACPTCHGLGVDRKIDPDLLIPDKSKSIAERAVLPFNFKTSRYWSALVRAVAEHYYIDLERPIKDLPAGDLKILLYGTGGEKIKVRYWQHGSPLVFYLRFEGLVSNLARRYHETQSPMMREEIERYMADTLCVDCQGGRLKKEVLSVNIANKNISEIVALTITQARDFFRNFKLSEKEEKIASRIFKEIISRLEFMNNVGLDYLTLDRQAGTLSGGEAQRIRLASQVGSGLVGVLYVLDEPTIGLHMRDNQRLLETLKRLRDLGNTILVVEHDRETIWSSDFVVDIGPGAGKAGGQIVACGPLEKIIDNQESLTMSYLRDERQISIPSRRRKINKKKFITLWQAGENNLKNITVHFPLGLFVCVTGVSGSGKSTLVNEVLYKALAKRMHGALEKPGKHANIEGLQHLDKVIIIDQSPIGRTPRSNPATYTGVFTPIREIFAATEDARLRGWSPGRFSFNISGGRCESCAGDGLLKIEMHFLPDVYVPCEVCRGRRFNAETLQIKYKGKNIADILEMTVAEALEFFQNIPQIKDKLQTIADVGLGYIQLGQSATTLSGGEAQRVKLSEELARRATGKTLYILDEPTTGLHFEDVKNLLAVLNRLVEVGNTVLVIEHNPDVIKIADYIIDLGPEGGEAGGRIVAEGTPEEITRCDKSYTGQYLKKVLKLG